MKNKDLQKLIEQQQPLHSLDRAFYTDEDIYRREIERIFLRAWQYAGHISEIPNTGD